MAESQGARRWVYCFHSEDGDLVDSQEITPHLARNWLFTDDFGCQSGFGDKTSEPSDTTSPELLEVPELNTWKVTPHGDYFTALKLAVVILHRTVPRSCADIWNSSTLYSTSVSRNPSGRAERARYLKFKQRSGGS